MSEKNFQIMKVQIEKASKDIQEVKETLKDKTDRNEVKVILEDTLEARDIVNQADMIVLIEKSEGELKSQIREIEIRLIKWIIATAISTAGVASIIFKYLSG